MVKGWYFVTYWIYSIANICLARAVVVAQLVERSRPIPDVRGSNPDIDKILFIYWTFLYCQLCIEKTKIKNKRPGMDHLKKTFREGLVWSNDSTGLGLPGSSSSTARSRSSTAAVSSSTRNTFSPRPTAFTRESVWQQCDQIDWPENTHLGTFLK